jgi:hypothetical protein
VPLCRRAIVVLPCRRVGCHNRAAVVPPTPLCAIACRAYCAVIVLPPRRAIVVPSSCHRCAVVPPPCRPIAPSSCRHRAVGLYPRLESCHRFVFPSLGPLLCCRRTAISKRPFAFWQLTLRGIFWAVVLMLSCLRAAVCVPLLCRRACHHQMPSSCRCAIVDPVPSHRVTVVPPLCHRCAVEPPSCRPVVPPGPVPSSCRHIDPSARAIDSCQASTRRAVAVYSNLQRKPRSTNVRKSL